MSSRLRTLFLLLILPASGAGCSRLILSGVPHQPPAPDVSSTCDLPPRPQVSTEADYWDAIAELVESGLIDNTDVVLKIADHLKEAGHLSDLSRLEAWRPKRVNITEENRPAILKTLRAQ